MIRCTVPWTIGRRLLLFPSPHRYRPGPFLRVPGETFAIWQNNTALQKEGPPGAVDAAVGASIKSMVEEVHSHMDDFVRDPTELSDMAKYYFDGRGKTIRPVICMTMAHALNSHFGIGDDPHLASNQRQVAIICELTHTATLIHDDVIDKALTRRGQVAINRKWGIRKSIAAGIYVQGLSSYSLSNIGNHDTTLMMTQCLLNLILGEFQQTKVELHEDDRFDLYLDKCFNKTAALIAGGCKAIAFLTVAALTEKAGIPVQQQPPCDDSASPLTGKNVADAAYLYGKNIGIAFQLIDDLLDFSSSSEVLGKPAAADLKLGLATAPVLFALRKHPELEALIRRKFREPGDVEEALLAVQNSDGLQQTKELAQAHCREANKAIAGLADSDHKQSLIRLTNMVVDRVK